MPQFVAHYNDKIKGNDIEVICVISSGMEAWAKKEKMTWPIMDRSGRDIIVKFAKAPKFVPSYYLFEKNGKLVAEGRSAVYRKVDELLR